MRALPFPPVWIGGDLLEFRACDSTYCAYDGRSLPRLPSDLFDGSFDWLRRHPSPLEYDERFAGGWGADGLARWRTEAERARPELVTAARDVGAVLPDSFTTFLFDIELVSMLRSPTDCSFMLSRHLIENRGPAGGHFVLFFIDSQWCYLWYLFLDPEGNHCVVAASQELGEDHSDEFWDNNHHEIVCCERDFEAFIYRLWIENEIWFRLVNQDQPLTEQMHAYLTASQSTTETER